MNIRHELFYLKKSVRRLPLLAAYQKKVWQNRTIREQAEALPLPVRHEVYWIRHSDLKLQGSLPSFRIGIWSMDGGWDVDSLFPLPSIFEQIPKESKNWIVHETIRMMFLKDRDYQETPEYQFMTDILKNKPNAFPRGCKTVDDIGRYFENLKGVYNSMKQNGYVTQKELGHPNDSEARIHITRNGLLCLGTGGKHRVRIAELLGIQWIPVIIKGIHTNWIVEICKKFDLPPHRALDVWIKRSDTFKQNP